MENVQNHICVHVFPDMKEYVVRKVSNYTILGQQLIVIFVPDWNLIILNYSVIDNCKTQPRMVYLYTNTIESVTRQYVSHHHVVG